MLDCSQESRAQQVTRAGESAKNHGFCIINHGSCSENEEFCTGNHGFCINDDGICSENDGFCSENDGICIENDIFCIENEKSSKSPGRPYGHVGVDTGALPYEHLFREQDAADDDDDGAVSGVSWAFSGVSWAFSGVSCVTYAFLCVFCAKPDGFDTDGGRLMPTKTLSVNKSPGGNAPGGERMRN